MLAGRDWKTSSHREDDRRDSKGSLPEIMQHGLKHRTHGLDASQTQQNDSEGGSGFTRAFITHMRKCKWCWDWLTCSIRMTSGQSGQYRGQTQTRRPSELSYQHCYQKSPDKQTTWAPAQVPCGQVGLTWQNMGAQEMMESLKNRPVQQTPIQNR